MRTPRISQSEKRRAAAVVELALTLPVFVLIFLATIEATSMIFLKQSLEIAAYEGARIAIIPGSDSSNVNAGCTLLLDGRSVQADSITVIPNDFDSQPYGTVIRVQVTAQCSDNSAISPWFYSGRTLTSDVSMMKEY